MDRSRSDSQGSQKENVRPKFVPLATPLVSVRETTTPWGTATKYAKYAAPTRKNGGKKSRKTRRKSRTTRNKRR
jgi:hypothetical protein